MASKMESRKSKAKRVKRDDKAVILNDDDDDPVGLEEIQTVSDNHTACVSDKISALLEAFDEKTCLDLLSGYHKILDGKDFPTDAKCKISGCEYDYSSNTYRLMAILTSGSVDIAQNFLIVKIDGSTGYPKVLSIK